MVLLYCVLWYVGMLFRLCLVLCWYVIVVVFDFVVFVDEYEFWFLVGL